LCTNGRLHDKISLTKRIRTFRSNLEQLPKSEVFIDFFKTKTNNLFPIGIDCIKGLFTIESRSNLTKISDWTSERDNQAFSHFLSNSPWDHSKITQWIYSNVNDFVGKNGALVIDEKGSKKKGKHSVGVKRQYSGNTGKVDNCQVGVYSCYIKAAKRIILDFKLYLPKEWCDDSERCDKAGVPQEYRIFKTKGELCLELIIRAIEEGVKFSFVCMDGFYGGIPQLLTKLEEMGITYMASVKSANRVYLEEPKYGIPPRRGKRGRIPTRVRVLNGTPVCISKIAELADDWEKIKVRDSTKGPLEAEFIVRKVWRIDSKENRPLPVLLLIRRELDENNKIVHKYSFCNNITINSLKRLAEMQASRYWIERSFQDAVDLAKMDDYQVRGWRGWHHHIALVILAMFYLWLDFKNLAIKTEFELTIYHMKLIIRCKYPLNPITSEKVAHIIVRNCINQERTKLSKSKKKCLNNVS